MSKHLNVGSTAATHQQRYQLVAKEETWKLKKRLSLHGSTEKNRRGEHSPIPSRHASPPSHHFHRAWENEMEAMSRGEGENCHLGERERSDSPGEQHGTGVR